jgi:transcriptional/translational regulatory protein YebC/TACO1
MNQILEKLKAVLQDAEALIESLKKQKNDLGLSHALLDKGLEELKTKNAEFSQREAAITPIENFNKVKKDNDAKSVELQTGLSDLDAKKKAFESYKASEMERIENLRLLASKENDNVVQAYKNLEAEVDKRVKEFVAKHLK